MSQKPSPATHNTAATKTTIQTDGLLRAGAACGAGDAEPGTRSGLARGHPDHDAAAEGDRATCEERATVPLAPGSESLNVATAGAIALYELSRRGG